MKTGREQLQNIKNNNKISLGQKNNIAMVNISLHFEAFLSDFIVFLLLSSICEQQLHAFPFLLMFAALYSTGKTRIIE